MVSAVITSFDHKQYDGTIIIYNLITDEDDSITAFAVDWLKAFADISNELIVFSTHVGRYRLPSNVKVYELGGGSPKKRLVGLFRLLRSAFSVFNIKGKKIVFHHMSERTACVVGPIYRILGIKQGLWYSHNRKSRVLILATKFVNCVFTPTANSFPIKSPKTRAVGHGISMSKFQEHREPAQDRNGILSLGRISKVKRLEEIIDALSRVSKPRPSLTFVGPVMEENDYVDALCARARASEVDLTIKGGMPYIEVPKIIGGFSMAFSGSPNTVDKSVLEAAATGCFVLSENKFVLELTGMKKVWDVIGVEVPLKIENQIELLKPFESDSGLRKQIARACQENNDVNNVAMKIVNSLALNEA